MGKNFFHTHKPFYEKGLQFECIRCGRCCTGGPGYVYLSAADINKITKYLQTSIQEFMERYTKTVFVFSEKRLSLIEKHNYDCIFWNRQDKGCKIYPARPYQCWSYPFWEKNLVSEWQWKKVARFCPGATQGKLYTRGDIEGILRQAPVYDVEKFPPRFLQLFNE